MTIKYMLLTKPTYFQNKFTCFKSKFLITTTSTASFFIGISFLEGNYSFLEQIIKIIQCELLSDTCHILGIRYDTVNIDRPFWYCWWKQKMNLLLLFYMWKVHFVYQTVKMFYFDFMSIHSLCISHDDTL